MRPRSASRNAALLAQPAASSAAPIVKTAAPFMSTPCRRLSIRILQPFVEPRQYFAMPFEAVVGLQDPVVLIRKDHESARDAAPLQRSERGESLAVRYAEIQLTVRDQHRRAPLVDMVHRVELLVVLRLFELRATMFPFLEPELFSLVVHAAAVEDAGVIHDAPES